MPFRTKNPPIPTLLRRRRVDPSNTGDLEAVETVSKPVFFFVSAVMTFILVAAELFLGPYASLRLDLHTNEEFSATRPVTHFVDNCCLGPRLRLATSSHAITRSERRTSLCQSSKTS